MLPNRLPAGLLYGDLISGEGRGQSSCRAGAAVQLRLQIGRSVSAHGRPLPSLIKVSCGASVPSPQAEVSGAAVSH